MKNKLRKLKDRLVDEAVLLALLAGGLLWLYGSRGFIAILLVAIGVFGTLMRIWDMFGPGRVIELFIAGCVALSLLAEMLTHENPWLRCLTQALGMLLVVLMGTRFMCEAKSRFGGERLPRKGAV